MRRALHDGRRLTPNHRTSGRSTWTIFAIVDTCSTPCPVLPGSSLSSRTPASDRRVGCATRRRSECSGARRQRRMLVSWTPGTHPPQDNARQQPQRTAEGLLRTAAWFLRYLEPPAALRPNRVKEAEAPTTVEAFSIEFMGSATVR